MSGNWFSSSILRRKLRSGIIRLGLARDALGKKFQSLTNVVTDRLWSLRHSAAPPPHPRPSLARMPLKPDPKFPVEIRSYQDGFIRAIADVGAAVPWPQPKSPPQRRVVMLAASNLRIDPRIERESRALAERGYEVVVVGPDISTPPLIDGPTLDWGPGVTFDILPANEVNFMGWAPWFYNEVYVEAAARHQPFAIHANDLWTCLIGLEAARRAGAVCVADFHEWTGENVSWDVATDSWRAHDEAMAAAFREMEILTMRRAAATITVNQTIAGALEELAGLAKGAVEVVRNIPKLDAEPTRAYRPIKQELGLPEDAFLVLYQGGTGPSRLLEPVIEALVYAKGAYLVIRGPSLDVYGKDYRRIAARAGVSSRLILADPVPSKDVVAAAFGADAGLWSLPDISKNFRYALPNKVFEYLASELPLLVANYPEPTAIVEAHQCGLTFDPYDPKSIGAAINRLHEDAAFHRSCKANTKTALASLDAESEWSRYADLFDRLWAQRAEGSPQPALKQTGMRVLHAPCNIGNQPWTLSRAERKLGLRSDLIINYSTSFGYPADRVLSACGDRTLNYLSARRTAAVGAPYDYDVFHYYFGRSLTYWDDLPDLNEYRFADLIKAKELGKPVFMTLQGCDARLAEKSNARNAYTPCAPGKCSAYETCLSTLDRRRMSLIDDVLPLCDRVFYLNPELGHYVPNGQFLPYANVDLTAFKASPAVKNDRPRIVHAPSNAAIKGSPAILAALDRLSKRHEFEVVLVENMTHDEAMKTFLSADIAIDQILAGWYGGFAVEMMAMGKPVMCYLREEDFEFVPDAMRADLPILNIRPDRLDEDIEAVLNRRSEWSEIARASRAFVEKWHDPEKIANWMTNLYANPKAITAFDPEAYLSLEAAS